MTDLTPTNSTPPQELTDEQLLELASGKIAPYDRIEPGIYIYGSELIAAMRAAIAADRAALAAEPPAPVAVAVAVAERPWERPGWCDAKGRCWWFAPTEAIPGGFRSAGWSLYAEPPADEDTHCLPHWAIPQPQSEEVQ